jgi:VWFA-related protein
MGNRKQGTRLIISWPVLYLIFIAFLDFFHFSLFYFFACPLFFTFSFLIAIPFGATALYDAIAYSVKIMKSIIGHNIIILLSDGEDNSSAIDPYTLMNIVERSNSVIYSIGKKEYMNSFDQYQEILGKISVSSGGMTFFLDDVDEVRKVYEKIRRDIKAKFLLRFSPKDKERRSRFRKITVKMKNHKGYKVRTMKGYFY